MLSEFPVNVTMAALCQQDEYQAVIDDIWSTGVLTHNGPLVQSFERELDRYLNSRNMVLVTNGTIALQLAIKALDLKGEIITTPFSWIATCSAIQAEGCDPVFVDIDPDTYNIDPLKIEDAITEKTVAIMPVHVFSNPCDIDKIDKIAKKHDLKVIYDAAHAMGVEVNNKSILEEGDVSTVSFHATKILNSGEGGGCVSMNDNIADKLKRLRFFGYDEHKHIVDRGLNGKMTELHAALGLANLKNMDDVLHDRKVKYERYVSCLKEYSGIKFQKIDPLSYNYSYMPIVFDSEMLMLNIIRKLNQENVFPRRYFYPSLNTVDALFDYEQMPVSEMISSRIACFPLYYGIEVNLIDSICSVVADEIR